MTLYLVAWIQYDDSDVVGIFTDEARAREVFDAFEPPLNGHGWLYLDEYEADHVKPPLELPKRLVERHIE